MKKTKIFLTTSLWLSIFSALFGQTKPLAEGKSKFFGCAWDYTQAPNFSMYWNQLTPGNAGKWGSVEGTRNVMNWTVLDSAYRATKKHNMLLKEHTLIWGAQQPSWIGALDSASQRQEIEQWFAAIAARYDSIQLIDVVNEPMNNAPNGMIPWGTTVPNVNYAKALGGAGSTGWDWVITAFRLARKYFPKSKLIINEYNVINSTTATKNYLKIIKLLKKDTLIDGIGEQAHAFTTYGTSSALLKQNLDSLATTGLPIYLTEVDIDGPTDLAQLKEMQRVFPIFWKHPAVKGITLWGFRFGVWRQDQKAYLITDKNVERPALKWLKAYVNDTITLAQSIAISATDNKKTIYVGEALKMSALVLPANTTIPNFSWNISPSSNATIDASGQLIGALPGKVIVTATAWDGSGKSDSYEVTIIKRYVQSVTISASGNKDTIKVGDLLQMSAAVLPENATNTSITWSVAPSYLAEINTSGVLSAIAPGTVEVKATAKDGSTIFDTLSITIIDKNTNLINETTTETIIYPNPVIKGTFTLNKIERIKQIEILDLNGRVITKFENLNRSSLSINLKLKTGLYIIKFFDGQQSVYKKILVSNQ